MKSFIGSQIQTSMDIKKALIEGDAEVIVAKVSRLCVDAYKSGKKLLIAGNGGSAADAQHLAGELVSKFYFDRPALPAIALTTDTSILTAIGNDYGFDEVFARQLQANGNAGDVFLGISTSGNSPNLLRALEVCGEKGIYRVGLCGRTGGKMADLCDYCIKVPSDETPRIQECHIMIGHIICSVIEEAIFGAGFRWKQ